VGSILEQVCNLLAVLLWVSTAVHAAQNSLIQPCRRLVFALFFSCQLAILLNETLRTSKKSCSGFCFCLVCVMRRTSFASNKSVHNTHSLHQLGYSVMQGCPSAFDRSVFKQSIDSSRTYQIPVQGIPSATNRYRYSAQSARRQQQQVSVVPHSYAKNFIHASDRYREWVWVSAFDQG